MSRTVCEAIAAGLTETVAYMDGSADRSHYRVNVPSDVDLIESGS